MTKENLRFYNMIIHLIQNNKLYEENAAIKKYGKRREPLFLISIFIGPASRMFLILRLFMTCWI